MMLTNGDHNSLFSFMPGIWLYKKNWVDDLQVKFFFSLFSWNSGSFPSIHTGGEFAVEAACNVWEHSKGLHVFGSFEYNKILK